jgi:hypothetical protein
MAKRDAGLDDTATPDVATAATADSGSDNTLDAGALPTLEQLPVIAQGRYELGDEVGRGGLGRVVHAHDKVLDRAVAVKELHGNDANARARFVREALITARLQHPSIVPIYEAGRRPDGAPFYTMKLVGGRSFHAMIAEAKTLEARLALVPTVLAVADALAYAHNRGIIHRDLKPGNILVGEFGETIVIDWGLAKDLGIDDRDALPAGPYRASNSEQTIAGALLGTPAYMAPEQAAGEEVDERADVYALGAILYNVIVGVAPHAGTTLDEMIEQIVAGKIPPIAEREPNVPPDLAAIVGKAMERDRTARYRNAKQIADELRRFQTGQLVGSYRYSRFELVKRFVRRNRVPLSIALVAAIVLAAGGFLAVKNIMRERNLARERNDRLVLLQARAAVTANPTHAVAIAKSMPPAYAGEARSITIAARMHGVAWSAPVTNHVVSVELSHGGTRALVAGADGSLRIYDLEKRTSHALVEHGESMAARWADGDRTIHAWSPTRLVTYDAASGTKLADRAGSFRDVEAHEATVYWLDETGAAWMAEQRNGTATRLPCDERIDALSVAPDGRWIVLFNKDHVLQYKPALPAEPCRHLAAGRVIAHDWSADSKTFALIVVAHDPGTPEVRTYSSSEPSLEVLEKHMIGSQTLLAVVNRSAYYYGAAGVRVVLAINTVTPPTWTRFAGEPLSISEAFHETVVAASTGGLFVITESGEHTVPVPSGRLTHVVTSARERFVVGITEGHMLVWNLAEIVPRAFGNRPADVVHFAGGAIVAAFPDEATLYPDLLRFDLATGTPVELPLEQEAIELAVSDDAARVVSIARGSASIDAQRTARLHVAGAPPVELGNADHAAFATDFVLAIDGAVVIGKRTLVSRSSKVVRLDANRDWIAAAFADGTLWRARADGSDASTTTLGSPAVTIAIARDGAVTFVEHQQIRLWQTTGALEKLYELQSHDSVAARIALAPETGLVVLVTHAGIEIIDPRTQHRWVLAYNQRARFAIPAVSRDGRYVAARGAWLDILDTSHSAIFVWDLATPDATQLTNAVVDSSLVLEWNAR